MNRRKFIKQGSLFGTLLTLGAVVGVSNAKTLGPEDIQNIRTLLKNSTFKPMGNTTGYQVVVRNVHPEHFSFKDSKENVMNVTTNNIYPFSLPQGDFGIQLRSMSNDFVAMNLFKLNKKGYQLVGENIGNTNLVSTNKMTWLKHGVRVLVSASA